MPFARAWVSPLPQKPVVDLGFLTGLDILAEHGDLRTLQSVRERGMHPPAERGDGYFQLVLVPQPLMDRGDRHRPQQALDVVTVPVDLRPSDPPQT